MAKLSKYQTLQKKLMSQTTRLFDLKDAKELCDALSNGQNSYLRFDRFESTAMDMTWIKEIEDCIPDLNEIVSNPKRTIQTLAEVVEVEKVKKTSHESVQHLASHSQFVKTIDEDGNVTPSKILNVYNDDFFAIYENKFVATLLRRLFVFVEKRYDYIIHQATLKDVELLYFKNKTNIDGSEIEIETKIRYSKPALEEADEKMKEFLRRINDIRRYLRFFGNSEFMRILHRERDVRNPILQTNIIRKNPKYRHCYHLWQFINAYNESGIEVKVQENYAQLNEKDLQEINKVLTINFLALKGRDAPKEIVKPKIYRPRILKTYDDEMFNPGANFDGPIEFVRVDDKYRQYKEGLKDLNPHPTRAMAEYYKEDYDENRAKREETKQVDSLLKRKENEYEKYQKEQEKLLIKEQEDLEMISDLAEQQIIEEQEEALQPYRDMLAKKGKEDEIILPSEPKEEEEPVVEEQPVEEEKPVEEKQAEEPPVEELQEEVQEEQPQEETQPEEPIEPIKKKRGGARPGAGRKPKPKPEPEAPAMESEPEPQPEPEPVVEEQPVKKQRGGARPGAGRKPKPQQEEQVVEEPVKKQRGGARPGAGRKPKPKPEEEPIKKQRGGARPGAGRKPKVAEPVKEPEPVVEPPKPVVTPKPTSKKERRLAKKAAREEKQAKILNVNTSRKGKKFGRR